MAEELQSLLEKIHRDGIEKAAAERDEMLAKARSEAAAVVAAAREEAAKMRAAAENDAEALKKVKGITASDAENIIEYFKSKI